MFDEYNFKAREELGDQAADSICRYLDTLYERWEGFFHSKDYEETEGGTKQGNSLIRT